MAILLLGAPVVEQMKQDIIYGVRVLQNKGIHATLAFIRAGNNPSDLSYEKTAKKRAEARGIATKSFVLPVCATKDDDVPSHSSCNSELFNVIKSINSCSEIHACLMFRPLPEPFDNKAAAQMLDCSKDIDGITPSSLEAVFSGSLNGFPPCTAAACVKILDYYHIPLSGKQVVIIGRSLVVGKPLSMMLLERNATVTIAHSFTQNLHKLTQQADIVVCATGRARAYGAEFFSEGQTVLDVGINVDNQGNLCGDVDFDSVEPVVDAITPVPGGIGSVTTEVLMSHVLRAAQEQS